MGFKQYLFEKNIPGAVRYINEKAALSAAFIENGDNKKELIQVASKEDLETAFFIKGIMPDGACWYFLYKELVGLTKSKILKEFEKMFTAYSIGTGVDNFTRISIENI